MTQSNYENCSWIYTDDDGQQALAVVTDIQEFRSALLNCIQQAKTKKLRNYLEVLLESVEFAPVTIKKNGKIHWQNGEFAQETSTGN